MKYSHSSSGFKILALEENDFKDVLIVDVREPDEFSAFHLPKSINVPLSNIRLSEFEKFSNQAVCLICNTGARAKAVAKKLDLLGFNNVFIADKHLDQIDANSACAKRYGFITQADWTVDRQFRFTLGLLLAIFLLLSYFGVQASLVIPGILASGLIITAIIDKCFLRTAISKLPWNN